MGVPRYMSQATLARRFGVTRTAFANWLTRYPPGSERLPTPAPDAYLDDRPLWLEDSVEAWDTWFEHHVVAWQETPVRDAQIELTPGPYMTQVDIARCLGVKPQTVQSWRTRFDGVNGMETPPVAVVANGKPYWRKDQLPDWEAWLEARPAWRAERVRKQQPRGKLGPRPDSTRAQILAAVRSRIDQGHYPVGEPLPPLEALAEEFGATTMTAQRAVKVLQEEGMVARVGKRLTVCRPGAAGLSRPPWL